jgi:starch-binding outer membrane protein, SusD/RagB family
MKLRQYIYVIVIIALVSACKKNFLEVPVKNAVFRQAYVTDLVTTGDYLNGIYIELARFISNTGLNYTELIADNIKPVTGSPVFTSYYGWNQQADDSKPAGIVATGINANGFWLSGIRIARECSFVIENADKYREQDPEKADNFKGQAYAMRAFIHSMMINVFAQSYSFTADASHPGIPYITSSDWTQPATRLTVAEVYNGMITDLNDAIQLLPNTQVVPSADFAHSRWHKTGAKALLARIYLFKQDWLAAKNLATEVSMAVPIMTGTGNYPSRLFTNKEAEALFQLPPSSSATTAGAGSYNIQYSASWYSGTTYYLVASSGIASLLRENPADVRGAWVKDTTSNNIAIKKFPSNVYPGFSIPSVSYFQTLLRSSEMYLTAAECYAQLQNQDSAIYYLDAIRKRAVPLAPSTTATGTALLDSIYKERRKELAFEGLRMFDIQRWKQDVNRSAEVPANMRILSYGSDKAIAPIPSSDVLQLGMPQNSGY